MDYTAGYMVAAHKILVSAPVPWVLELGSTGLGLGLGGLGLKVWGQGLTISLNLLEARKLLREFQYFRSLLIFLCHRILLRQRHGSLNVFCVSKIKMEIIIHIDIDPDFRSYVIS